MGSAGIGGLSDMLGMGVVIQLRNLFSVPAQAVERSSRALATSISKDQNTINSGWRLMAAGGSFALVGSGLIAALLSVSKHTLKASNDLEILRNQIRLMAKDQAVGDSLFGQLTQFAIKTPFTIPQIMAGARNLMAFGFTADRVMGQLQMAGEWAAMMNERIDYISMILGKVRTGGIAYAMRFAQARGISYRDIEEQGGPVDPKTHMTKKGADPEAFLLAMDKAIQKKFSGGMALYMSTLPGMMTNIKDQMILLAASIGDRVKPMLKETVAGTLAVFDPKLSQPFARAFGDGLTLVMRMARMALAPIAMLVVWVMRLSKEHPGFVKYGTAAIAITGALLVLAGATMLAFGAYRMFVWAVGAEALASARTAILRLLGPMGWLAVASLVLYVMWRKNIFGVGDAINKMAGQAYWMAKGIIELFTSIKNGVGTMSMATANALEQSGMMRRTVTLYQVLYRVYQVLCGVWEAGTLVVGTAAVLAAAVYYLITPLRLIVNMWLSIAEYLGANVAWMRSSTWKVFGFVLGTLASVYVVTKIALMGYNTAMLVAALLANRSAAAMVTKKLALLALRPVLWAVTAAQWAWNYAMYANPIVLLVGAIAAAITYIIAMIKYAKELTGWFNSLGPMGRTLATMFIPFLRGTVEIYQRWGAIKEFFQTLFSWLKNSWDTVIKGMYNGVIWLVERLAKVLRYLPGKTGAYFTKIDDESKAKDAAEAEGAKHKLEESRMSRILASQERQARAAADMLRMQDSVNTLATRMDAMTKQPLVVSNQLKLDSKTIGSAVTTYQRNRKVGGKED